MPRSRSRNKPVKPSQSVARPTTPQPTPHPGAIFQQQTKFHHGPIPAGEELALYERLLPGAADRILTMAERQAEHRQALETASLTSDSIARDNQIDVERNRIEGVIFNERLGQFFGFAVAVGCVGFAGWGMMNGASATVIGLFLGLPIAGVIKAFINGRQGHPKPRAEKS